MGVGGRFFKPKKQLSKGKSGKKKRVEGDEKHLKIECILVNTSRRKVINGEALCLALREGVIGGGVLDVFSVERCLRAVVFGGFRMAF